MIMKFNITYDTQIFSWQKFGGISRIYKELINEFTKDPNINIKLSGRYHINEYLRESNIDKLNKLAYIPIMSKFPGKINQIMNRKYFFNYLQNIKCDIYHETYYDSFSCSIPKKASRIITVYDMIDEKLASKTVNNPLGSKILLKDKENSIRRADHIICISESTRNDLIDILNIPKSRTSVVYLGSHLANDKNIETCNGINQEKFILFVGSRGGYKNFNLLLEAIGSSQMIKNNYKLYAFGGGVFNESEISMIKKIGINAFQLSGNDKRLAYLYKNASIFVYPSMYEGFGIPPLEAMQFGCPVVCTKSSSIPEVVSDAGKYFINNDPESLKESLELVLTNKNVKNELIEKGFERVKLFTWKKCAQSTLDVYKKIAI